MTSTTLLVLGVSLIALGLVALPMTSAATYRNGRASPVLLELTVYSCFSVSLIGTVISLGGILSFIDSRSRSQEQRSTNSWKAKLRLIIRDPSSRNVRVVSAVVYGAILSILSGLLVIQPAESFSTSYGVAIPSSTFAVCCGSIGQMPQLVMYLSDNVGLVVTPLGLILLLAVSWLVGSNVSAVVLSYRTRTVRGNRTLLTSMGSFLGIFSVCPSCAQGLLAAILGGSGVAFVTILSSYQGYFIAASIPLLVISLVWTARSLSRGSSINCALPSGGSGKP